MTLEGAGALSTRPANAMMRLREGTGGKFGNMILANVATHPGIRIDTCTNASSAAHPAQMGDERLAPGTNGRRAPC